jgi:metal-responsive CopG/Arc/MetJ family transcriptional regulator
MSTTKVAVTIDRDLLVRLDRLVRSRRFPSRSRAVQEAISEKLARLEHSRLAEECAKLDRVSERKMADEGLSDEATQWPEY